MKQKIKRKIAGFLATCMVSSILSPAMPGYAAPVHISTGDPVKVIYQLGQGPGPDVADGYLWNDVINHHDVAVTTDLTTGDRQIEIDGKAGMLYDDQLSPFAYYTVADGMVMHDGHIRPDFPTWNYAIWPGYIFDGWHTDAEFYSPIVRVDPSFPYYNPTTYYAKWRPDTAVTYAFTTDYKRNGGGVTLDFFAPRTQQRSAEAEISALRRNVPGYDVTTVALFPEKSQTFYDTQTGNHYWGNRNGYDVKSEDSTLTSFRGKMPNEDLDVTFTYEPNPNKKFNLTVNHIFKSTDPYDPEVILQRDTAKYPAETNIPGIIKPRPSDQSDPLYIPGYVYDTGRGYTVTAGDVDDIVARGVYNYARLGGAFDASGNFTGKMPNQTFTVNYYYKLDPNYVSTFKVDYVDENGENLFTDPNVSDKFFGVTNEFTISPANPSSRDITVVVPDLSSRGYQASYQIRSISGCTVMPNVSGAAPTGTEPQFDLQSERTGGHLVIQYSRDVNDNQMYATLNLSVDTNGGTVAGIMGPRRMLRGIYAIDENNQIESLEALIEAPVPAANYLFDGWYEVDAANNKLSQTPLTAIDLNGVQPDDVVSKNVRAFFKKDPDAFKTVTFKAGAHVSFTGDGVAREYVSGSIINTIAPGMLGSIAYETGYQFSRWMDSQGNTVIIDGTTTLTQNETYTLYAAPIVPPEGSDLMNRPNAAGEVGNDGRGVISVDDSEIDPIRKYVVTDEAGNVVGRLSGQQIINGQDFTNLDPGAIYKVYEVSADQDMTGVNHIDDVTEDKSLPNQVFIPAIKEAIVENDSNNAGKTQIIVNPADPTSEYALIDEDGNVIHDWKVPTTNPDQVIFDDLDPDRNYTVVVKPGGDHAAPGDKKDYGSDVSTYLDPTRDYYTIETLNGKIVSVAGTNIDDSRYSDAEAGQRIKIEADPISGKVFKHWRVLLGTVREFGGNYGPVGATVINFTMPEENVVLAAIYEEIAPASPSVAVDYRVNAGYDKEVTLDLDAGKKEALEEALGDNPKDQNALANGKKVKYLVDFTKRRPVASESNATKEAGGYRNESYKGAWALDVELLRRENNGRWYQVSKPDSVVVDVIAQIDAGDLGHVDYELWKVYKNDQGVSVAERVAMNPDADEDLGNGLFRFEANVDCTYVLTYARTNTVTIIDPYNGNANLKVKRGESLADCPDYLIWVPENYIDANGMEWYYEGLSKTQTGNVNHGPATNITRNLTLYAVYIEDQEWINAKDQLEDLINTANNLLQDPNLTDEEQAVLEETIEDVNNILTGVGTCRPNTDDLNHAHDNLKEVVDSIVGGGSSIR